MAPSTPLTGRKYLKMKDLCSIAPVSNATHNVIQLRNLIGAQALPSGELLELLNTCSSAVKETVEMKVTDFGRRFVSAYTQNADNLDVAGLDLANKRLCMAQSLFYKLLEMILNDEKRKKPNVDLSV